MGSSSSGETGIQSPRNTTDNPFIEAFNGRFRQECLDQNWFESLEDACPLIETWRMDDNTVRPHTALGHLTPAAYKEHWLQQQHLPEYRDHCTWTSK
jgi:transposase InsO family protein